MAVTALTPPPSLFLSTHLFNNDPYQQRSKDARDGADSVGNAHDNASEIGRDVDVIAVEATPKLSPVERLPSKKR